MVNVINKTCNHEGCITYPCFNFEGEKGIFCKEHKQQGMVNVINKTCNHEGCITYPCFNFEGEKSKFCSEHKQQGMVDVVNKTCNYEGCITYPCFNFEGEKGIFCNLHKKIGMINVKDKTCEYEDCKTHAYFGYINQPATRCTLHKLPLMFKNRKVKCFNENCDEISEYGKEEPTHCFIHKKDDELCLLGQICKQCGRKDELCNKDKICLTYCRPTELSIISKKIIKKKERMVLSYLDENIKTDIKSVDDKIIDTSCVKRRPDRVYDCGSFFVVVEIDENQHKSYKNGCSFDTKTQELRRMIQIHEALSNGMMSVIFLRFNPDNFRICGELKKINMQKRLEVLCKWVSYCINLKEDPTQSSIRIKYLFYDDYDETNLKFEKIDDIKSLIYNI